MSTYWGYRCVTCDVASPTWWNHGDDRLRAIWQARASLAPAMRVIANTPVLAEWIGVSTMGTYDPPFPLDFLLAHDGHTLVLQDEYDRQQPLEEDRMDTKFYHIALSLEGTPDDAKAWYDRFLAFVQQQVAECPTLPPYVSVSLNESTDDEESS